jgi:transglutaminase-like putative cysteine protease
LLILGVLGVALVPPLLGAWVASSLAVHQGALPRWAVAAGLGLSLGLPLAWEALSMPQRRAGGARPKRWLRLRTRLLLRTWAVNLVFLVGAVLLSPRGVFTALSTRGDWMLPAAGPPYMEPVRRLLFTAAGGVEWAYALATDNPYRDQLIALAPQAPSQPLPPPAPSTAEQPPPTPPEPEEDRESDVFLSWETEPRPPEPQPAQAEPVVERGEVAVQKEPEPREAMKPRTAGGTLAYPLPSELHPRVRSLPRDVETDLVSVAKYLVREEREPFQRIKALHDYVASRVEYDVRAYRSRTYPPQTPEAVFQNRRAVCAGYANLFAAMGHAVGEEVVTLTGDVPTPGEDWEFEGHAWNAVRIEGAWYLVDVTWDAGHVSGDLFTRSYTTNYLFMPPREFLQMHLPDEPGWQLLETPLDRGEAMRQARAYVQQHYASRIEPQKPRTEHPTGEKRVWEGIRIVEPSRPGAEVRGRFTVELDNPRKLPAEVSLFNVQESRMEPCHPEYGGARFACTVLSRGPYRIQVFAGAQTPLPLMAQLEVTGL